jgi:quercetin dioxygenase-like cupin family protein
MRPADTIDHRTASTTWSEADLVNLTIRLAHQSAGELASELPTELPPRTAPEHAIQPRWQPAPPDPGPLAGRVADRREGVVRPSTAPAPARRRGGLLRPSPAHGRGGLLRGSPAPADAAWSIPLLATPEVEAWLLGWPAGLVTPAHDHGGATVAVTVVEGSLSEECLDPTIWTTGRRTTWRAGASTLFPSGHVHLLGAAGDRPAMAVHAWTGPARSADRVAGRSAPARAGAAAGRDPGGGVAEPVGVGPGRGGDGRRAGHPVHGAADLVHVRDRVAG